MEMFSGAGGGGSDAAGPRLSVLEGQWLQTARDFACRALPGFSEREEADAAWRDLKRALSQCNSRDCEELPLGYSLVSISDLQSQQHVPCCSHLTWSSDEFRQWACQQEGLLPNQSILQQTHLILIGCLTDERPEEKDKLVDGSLYVRDNTGILPCELLHFKLEWLGCLLLFPSWAYIPQRGKYTAGYVEILADPVQVMFGPEKIIDIIPVFYPESAAQLLNTRAQGKKTTKLNVAGELSRLSTILYIHHKTFFFLFLKCLNSASCVPVLVQKTSQLIWHRALQLGHKYVLTALKVSCLKASGRMVFTTSSSSCLLPYCKEQVKEQFMDCASERSSVVSDSSVAYTQLGSSLELGERLIPVKKSKMISYEGTITRVINAHAGLYELDNTFILCLAYQQLLNSGRGLRPGAFVELQDIHLVQKPLATCPFVLGACLHSTVALKRFSGHSTLYQPASSFGNLYMKLLLQYNLSLPHYLWMVSLLETFEQRFCFIQHQQSLICNSHQVLSAAEKFVVPILNSLVLFRKKVRDVHQEILAEEHHCPLEQYQILEPPCQSPPFSLLHTMVEKRCWESHGPLQQLSSASMFHDMSAPELNRRLAWSYSSLSAESFQPRLVLLGVLECSRSGSLQLQDRSKALPCVIFHRDGRPFANTSLIGCLLQIEVFQLVTEMFLQSNIPSSKQLMALEYIKEKKTRLYVQFCFEDVMILHTPEKRSPEGPTISVGSSSGIKGDGISMAEPQSSEEQGLNMGRAGSDANTPEHPKSSAREASCVSRLFWVIQKEGLMWRNYLQASESKGEDNRTTQLCFQATVLWLGKPELHRRLGEIEGQQELKTSALGETGKVQQNILLLFLGKSLKWFPFLHPGQLYRLIIPHCMDSGEFDGLCCSQAPGTFSDTLGSSLFLAVPDVAHLHHVSHTSQLASGALKMEGKLFLIEEILSPSFAGSLVSFSGEIVERTLRESLSGRKPVADCAVQQPKGNSLPWDYTVKLSISPAPGSSLVLDVYVEATFLPYLWGLLPGARILFQNLQRKISRFRNVYCVYVASSCISILTPPPHDPSSHPPGTLSNLSMVYLFNILLQSPGLCQAQVICHLTCVLSLSLHWNCSLCNTVFKEGRCTQTSCLSLTGVSKTSARILVEDGTSEFVVLCRNQQVREVLGLSPKEWDAVQDQARSKGRLDIQHKGAGAGPGSTEKPEDLLTWYLRSLCKSPVVCRAIRLAFRLERKPPEVHEAGSVQLRRFFSNELEFLSQISNQRNLICLNIQEAT
ncbi:CST complex subunit CTC1 isoform X2 [Hemicordylus capensis]|uniref:CST complex subunit CTC1 isoform X2 n=1 Tax=Hemicordylus capensis TaxID=884348 RepID=UPI00230382B4|nr:CST complex subunit CTC1 isoform X2 [Hemicordylus capensis]XP_053154822.1 CST complex subunit CTC1 isoform X2 [Hemicordylus capensis]